MKNGVIVTLDKTKQIADGLRALADQKVLVGIPGDKNQREEGEITNAALGYIHEFGMPEHNVPARPSLLPGVKGSKKEWLPYYRAAAEAALSGNPGSVTSNLNAAGLKAVSAVRAYITNSDNFAPLKPSTIAARLRRGRTGTKPLIDTSQFLKAFTYIIRRGK